MLLLQQHPVLRLLLPLLQTSITYSGATLNGTVNPNGGIATVTFNYGLTTSYGNTVTATQSPVSGSTVTSVSAPITGLQPYTTYHFQVVGTNAGEPQTAMT